MSKTVRLGNRLRYPVTIQRINKRVGATVDKQEPLIEYSFKVVETVGDHIAGETRQEARTSVADWNSPFDGTIEKWLIKEGDVIEGDCACLIVKEACAHALQFAGMCALCGKDMTEVNWASETVDTARAPISMTHDVTNLTVSAEEALRTEHELQSRLLEQRKLSLVVDLDQTIIHACIEPTIGEWQSDPNNPNYESVKDVKSFQLTDEGPRGLATGCWYYIKLRPGLEEFLRKISDKYELHVYTMGTRAYALNIAKLVDPDRKLFGNRVISRDENGSMTAKSLQRLFPVSTNMVVIIDDRADVWPRNRPNLIKVVPYDFFKGIGDINSSFLPKREDILATPPAAVAAVATKNGDGTPKETSPAATKALQDLVIMSGADNPALTKRQIEQQAVELEKQIKDRPLLHLQEQLDKEDEEAEKTTPEASSNEEPQPSATPAHQRHQLLQDDDRELYYLEQHLLDLHKEYYREYDHAVARNRSAVPDVGLVLDSLKARVLRGTRLVLSGLVPIGMDVKKSELGLQVTNFGAILRDRVSRDITHLVVNSARQRTAKVRQAAQIPSIKIVNQQWLLDCLTQWRRVDETPHLIDIHPADRPRAKSAPTAGAEVVSDADDVDGAAGDPAGRNDAQEDEPDSEDERRDSEDEDDDDDDDDLEPDASMSPVEDLKSFDWEDADAELAEFLADASDDEDEDGDGDDDDDDDDDDDGDGTATDKDTVHGEAKSGEVSRKRKHAEDDDNDSVASETDSDNAGSLAKKQRLARDKPGSNLRTEYNADADAGLPTPQDSGDAEVVNGGAAGADTADDDEEEDELEADLLAELEAEEQEDREQEQRDEDSKGEQG